MTTSRRPFASPKAKYGSMEKQPCLPIRVTLSSSDCSDSSIETRDEALQQGPCHVRFAQEVDNQYIASPWIDFTQDDFDELWYTEQEMINMKQEALEVAKQVVRRNNQGNQEDHHHHGWEWHKALNRAYRAFCRAETVDDLHHVMAQVTEQRDLLSESPDAIQVLGLEKWLVKSFAKDRIRRRSIMMQEILYCQFHALACASDNVPMDDEAIGEVCRDISRSSRMFAFHVGRMLAMQHDA